LATKSTIKKGLSLVIQLLGTMLHFILHLAVFTKFEIGLLIRLFSPEILSFGMMAQYLRKVVIKLGISTFHL